MKKVLIGTLVAFLAVGCGGKKKTTYSKRNKDRTRVAVTKPGFPDDGLYPLPKDDGSFMKFRIESVEDYIDTFSDIAMAEMEAYGIPASITLAQGILESGFGRSELAQKTNNHFGIKCHTGWNGQFDYHDDDRKGECFRKYNHPMYSFRDHSVFLSSRSRYARLFELRRDDYKGWAKGLKKAGYATDPRYPQKLINFIEKYNLKKYDRKVIKGGLAVKAPSKSYDFETYQVKKGDTLYSISRRYFVTV